MVSSISSGEKRIVIDVLQAQLEDMGRENKMMKMKMREVRKEKEEETELFNKKVEELQEKFLKVEERVKLKDLRIEELKKRSKDPVNKSYVDLERRNEELKKQLDKKVQEVQKLTHQLEEKAIDTETVYESLEFQDSLKPKASKSHCKQLCSCFRCSIVIIFSVSIIISILVVLPLKIILSK